MGGVFRKRDAPQRNTALEAQLKAQQDAERKRADELAAKQAATAYKQAKGLYGARSLFGKAGGRGYFDTV